MIANAAVMSDFNSAFYKQNYRNLSELLRSFALVYHSARQPSRESDCRQLLNITDRIIAVALTVVSNSANQNVDPAQTPHDFIDRLNLLLTTLILSGNDAYKQIGNSLKEHISYAQKSLATDDSGRYDFTTNNLAYLRDCSVACVQILTDRLFNSFQWHCPDPRTESTFFDPSQVNQDMPRATSQLLESVKSLQGWCSDQKAGLLYSLIRQHRPSTAVEIGIYGGRSIIPIAAALRDNNHGHIYGIETWSGSAATTYRTNLANDFWWMNIDFSKIKSDFLRFIVDYNIHDLIHILEAPSDKCGPLFDSIDFLHIDGGHSTYGAAQDVVNYVSKVPSGGIIVYDDINWPSTSAGLDILRDCCQLLHVVAAYGSTTEPGCAAFVKI